MLRTKIKINLVFVNTINDVQSKTDGVGSLRLEHMISQFEVHPAKLMRENRLDEYLQMLIDWIKPIASIFYPIPVWVRHLMQEQTNLGISSEVKMTHRIKSNAWMAWNSQKPR